MSRFDRWLDLFSVVPRSNPQPRFFINTIIIIMTCSFPLIPLRQLCVLKKKKRRKRRRRRRSSRRRRRRRSSSSSSRRRTRTRTRRTRRRTRRTRTRTRTRRTRTRTRTEEGGETNPEIAQSNGSASRYCYI